MHAPGDGIEQFASEVAAAIDAGGYDVVFAARDTEAAALAFLRDRLPARVAHPDIAIFAAALDKLELSTRAQAAGFAVPATVPVGWPAPAEAVVVKPRVGASLVRAMERGEPPPGRAVARLARGDMEIGAAAAEIEAAGDEPLIQERVAGDLVALVVLAGLDHSLVRSYQQRAELCWPLDAGISVRSTVVPVDPGLAERAAALLGGLRWTGLAQLQFLHPPGEDPRLIDFNGRFFGSLALARAAGCDVTGAWARGVLEGSIPDPGPARVGTRYHWAWGDMRRATQERRGGMARDLLGVARYARGAAHSVFDPRDPRPALRYARIAGARAGRRRVGHAEDR